MEVLVNESVVNGEGKQNVDANIYHRAKNWQIALFCLTSGSGMAFYILMNYVSYVAAGGYGIATGIIGLVMTLTRMFDGITDPIVAIIVEKTNTRIGKIRIFMFLGWGLEALACGLMFVVCSNGQHGLPIFVLLYSLYIIGNTFFGVSTNICGPVLTNDPAQRPMIARWGTCYSYAFPMIFNILVTMVLLPLFDNNYSVEMLSVTCVGAIVVSFVLVVLAAIGISEFDKTENFVFEKEEEHKVGFKEMWSFIKSNDAFTKYAISASATKLAFSASGQAIVSTMFYGIVIGDMQLGTIFSMITMLPSVVFLFISTRIATKKGNKESMMIWTYASIVITVIAIIYCYLNDMTQIMHAPLVTIGFFIIMLLQGGFRMGYTATSGIMLTDIVDYEMSRSDKFIPATVTGTFSFIDKMVSSLAALFVTGCVALIGYSSTLPQPSDALTDELLAMTMFLTFGMPIIGFAINAVVMRKYLLTREKMEEVQIKNNEIRNRGKQGKSLCSME